MSLHLAYGSFAGKQHLGLSGYLGCITRDVLFTGTPSRHGFWIITSGAAWYLILMLNVYIVPATYMACPLRNLRLDIFDIVHCQSICVY